MLFVKACHTQDKAAMGLYMDAEVEKAKQEVLAAQSQSLKVRHNVSANAVPHE